MKNPLRDLINKLCIIKIMMHLPTSTWEVTVTCTNNQQRVKESMEKLTTGGLSVTMRFSAIFDKFIYSWIMPVQLRYMPISMNGSMGSKRMKLNGFQNIVKVVF
jgi:hypothetical protein